MNNIKTYVENGTMKVFFNISYNGKRFMVSTGLVSTEKFIGLVFPQSVPNHRVKTLQLTKIYSSLEEYMLTHDHEPLQQMKEHLKSIINGKENTIEKNILYYIDEYIKAKTKDSTKQVFLTTKARIGKFDEHATFDTIDRSWLERFQAHELIKGRLINGIAIDLTHIAASGYVTS